MEKTIFTDEASVSAIQAFAASHLGGSLSALAREMRAHGINAVVRVGTICSLDPSQDFGKCTARVEGDELLVRSEFGVITRVRAPEEDDVRIELDPFDPDDEDQHEDEIA